MPSQASSEVTTLPEYTVEHRKAIASEIGKCLLVQETYGKQGNDMKATMAIFIDDLKQYEPEEVVKAIIQHRKTSSKFVTVAALEAILNPQPILNYAVYSNIKDKIKSGQGYISDKERAYIKAYEQNAISGA